MTDSGRNAGDDQIGNRISDHLRDSLREFVRSTPPRGRSRLMPYRDDIRYLLNHRYSLGQIAEYLRTQGLKVTRQSIDFFIRRHVRPNTKAQPESPQKKGSPQ